MCAVAVPVRLCAWCTGVFLVLLVLLACCCRRCRQRRGGHRFDVDHQGLHKHQHVEMANAVAFNTGGPSGESIHTPATRTMHLFHGFAAAPPRPTPPCRAVPCLALPCLALPCLALPAAFAQRRGLLLVGRPDRMSTRRLFRLHCTQALWPTIRSTPAAALPTTRLLRPTCG